MVVYALLMDDVEFRKAVGNLAHNAAVLESVTAILAWGLAGVEQKIARIVVPNNMDRMLSLIKDLLPHRVDDPALRAEAKAWTDEVRAVWQQRNAVLHSVWIWHDGEDGYMRADLRPFRDKPIEVRSVEYVQAATTRMKDLASSEISFLSKLAETVPGPWSVGASRG
jgi:hypothetical protein